MFSKKQRLNLKKDFKWVAAGKKLESKYLKLFVRMGENTWPKVGVALSSQTFKKAHDRNRAKRLASSAFGVLYGKLPQNINIVALPKAGVLSVKSGDLLLDLEENLKDDKIID